MDSIAIYVAVISVYFICMLGVSIFLSKRARSESDFFLARDQLPAVVIGFTYSATQMSGSSYLGSIGTVRTTGYAYIPSNVSSAAAPWFTYILLGDRIRKVTSRLGSITISDLFEARFGKRAGLYSAVIMLIGTVPVIAAQLKAAGSAFEIILGIPYISAIFIFGAVTIIYTVVGGMFAVAWTDLIQGALMILGFVIMLPVTLNAVGGFTQMNLTYAQIRPEAATFDGGVYNLMWAISAFLVWGFYQIGGQPSAVTRFMTTSDDKKLKSALVYSIVFQSFIYFSIAVVGLCSAILLPDLANSDLALPTLTNMYLHPLVGGIVLSAALGVMMSTLDSVLLMTSSLFSQNIWVKALHRSSDDRTIVRVGRITTLVIGVLGLIIAIDPPDAIIWIITMGFSFMAGAFTFPILLGLWSEKTTPIAGRAGMVSGFIGTIVWYILGYNQYGSLSKYVWGLWPAVFGSLVSLMVMLVVSRCSKPTEKEILDIFFDDTEVATK